MAALDFGQRRLKLVAVNQKIILSCSINAEWFDALQVVRLTAAGSITTSLQDFSPKKSHAVSRLGALIKPPEARTKPSLLFSGRPSNKPIQSCP
jgi:hypothetical protein